MKITLDKDIICGTTNDAENKEQEQRTEQKVNKSLNKNIMFFV